MKISTSHGYYPHFVDIIYIDHIKSYLAPNERPIFNIFSFSESDWCITSFPACNLIIFFCSSSFCLVRFVSEYKLNPNNIQIYVPSSPTSIKAQFSFPLNNPISVLYWCVIYLCYMNDYNISNYIYISDKGWRLPSNSSYFLNVISGNGTMPLNPCPKRPPYVVF